VDGASAIVPAKETAAPNDRAVTFRREGLLDVMMDLGPLFRMHDREVYPKRNWGKIRPNFPFYMQMEAQGVLHIIAARSKGKLVGYCAEMVTMDEKHAVKQSRNNMFFLHPDYRKGVGLSVMKSPGVRMLIEREALLDDLKVVRRLMETKMHVMFGPLLERLGYSSGAVIYEKIGNV
jgi:hypothetical protein